MNFDEIEKANNENTDGKYGMPYRRDADRPAISGIVLSNDYIIQKLKILLTQEESTRKLAQDFVSYFKRYRDELRSEMTSLLSNQNYKRLGASVAQFLVDMEANLKEMETKVVATESEMHSSDQARTEINDLIKQSPQNLREVVKQETLHNWEETINLNMKGTVENINLFRKAAETFFGVANEQVTEIENILKEPQKTQA